MREIKFRGKTKDGRWVQGVPIKNGFGKLTFMCFATSDLFSCPMEQIYKFCIEVIPETVTQYAELKDKNGVEIYEGDIVISQDGTGGLVYKHIVEWNEFYKRFEPMGEDEAHFNRESCEVVGNIYENPELLKDRIQKAAT